MPNDTDVKLFPELFSRTTQIFSWTNETRINFERMRSVGRDFRAVIDELARFVAPLNPQIIIVQEENDAFGTAVATRLMYQYGFASLPIHTAYEKRNKSLPLLPKVDFHTLEMDFRLLEAAQKDFGDGFRAVYIPDVVKSGSEAGAIADMIKQTSGQLVGIACAVEFVGPARAKISRILPPVPMRSIVKLAQDPVSPNVYHYSAGETSNGGGHPAAWANGNSSPSVGQHHQIRPLFPLARGRTTHKFNPGPGF